MSKTNRLSIPAVRQILARLAKGEKEEDELVEKLEDSCLRYDHDKKGVSGHEEEPECIKSNILYSDADSR